VRLLERLADLAQIARRCLEAEHGRAHPNIEPGHIAKRRRKFLGQAVGQRILIGIARDIGQRQHSDRDRTLRRGTAGAHDLRQHGEAQYQNSTKKTVLDPAEKPAHTCAPAGDAKGAIP